LVLMLRASEISETKIFPSPLLPVRAFPAVIFINFSVSLSSQTSSIFTVVQYFSQYSIESFDLSGSAHLPSVETSIIVIPGTPASSSAEITRSAIEGLI
jgi:hypothetical protein